MIQKILNKIHHILSDSSKKEVLLLSGVSFLLNMSSVGLGFILLFLIARIYGVEGTGLFSIGQAFIIIFSTISVLGLNTATIRFIGQFSKDRVKISSLYKKSVSLIFCISILLALALFFSSDVLAYRFFGDPRLSWVIKISAVIVPFCAIKDYHSDFFKGFKKIIEGEIIKKFLYLFLACSLLVLIYIIGDQTIYDPIISFVIAIGITALFSFILIYKNFGSLIFTKSTEKSLSYQKILSVSIPMVITVIAIIIMGNIDKLMIGYFLDTASVGVYNVTFSMAIVLNFVIRSVNAILAPKISEKFWNNDMKGLQADITFGTKLIFYFTLPLVIFLIIFGKNILGLFGDNFTTGYTVLLVLCLGQFINSLSGSTGFFLNMTGNEKVFQFIVILTVFLNIIFNIMLIPMLGILGAAISTAVSISIWNLWSIVYIKRKYGIKTYYLGARK